MRMRIATPVCGLVRNDMSFVTIRIKLGAGCAFLLSLRGGMQHIPTWQSVLLYTSNYNLAIAGLVIPSKYLPQLETKTQGISLAISAYLRYNNKSVFEKGRQI